MLITAWQITLIIVLIIFIIFILIKTFKIFKKDPIEEYYKSESIKSRDRFLKQLEEMDKLDDFLENNFYKKRE